MAVLTSTYPSLESGDHLARDEFHRRYLARPDIRKAELVEGIVYVAPRARFDPYAGPNEAMTAWLARYRLSVPGVQLGAHATVLLDARNELQPDALLFREQPGGPRLTPDDSIEGPPQFVVEVAASSASYDLHPKKEAYRRNGVREYVVWRPSTA